MHRARVLVLAAMVAGAWLPGHAQSAGKPPLVFESSSLPSRQREQLTRYAETVSRWAMVQRVVVAVTAQNAQPQSPERIAELDAAWQRGEDPEGLVGKVVGNECAAALQAVLTANPGYVEAMVTDQQGALVCATLRTSDYYQADEGVWRGAWAEGAGALFVSNSQQDESALSQVIYIAVPVRSAGRVIGVLTVARLVGG